MADPGSKVRLDRQPSKLDLIDSSTLTSLPFPPPLKTSKRAKHELMNRSKSTPNIHHTDSDPQEILSTKERSSSPQISDRRDPGPKGFSPKDFLATDNTIEDVSFTSIDTLTTQNMTTEIDESFDDNEEPIILVEDYMNLNPISTNKPSSFPHQSISSSQDKHPAMSNEDCNKASGEMNPQVHAYKLFRQRSLASFKHRLNANNRNKRKISGDTNNSENLEAIFGTIPGKGMLKHCDICDKPLYEISSVISSKRTKNNKTDTEHDLKNPELNNIFNEFICFDCIEIYEEFLHELYNNELHNNETDRINGGSISDGSMLSGLPELKNLKLLNMFKSIQLRSMNNFQNNLVDQLKLLNYSNITQAGGLSELNWLKTLQNKLRWRWRLNGLLPSFRKSSTPVNRN